MLAPPVDFFWAPRALKGLAMPIFLRSGGRDTITPPQAHDQFAQKLSKRMPLDFAIIPEAGHFSFMDVPPPGQDEPMPGAEPFRARLADEIASVTVA